MAKITLFGFAGTGKGATSRLIHQRLGYEVMSNGNFARKQAEELKMTIVEMDELSRTTDVYDKMRDKMIEEYGKTHDNFVAEGRLGWYSIPDSVKVKLDCNFDVRVKRVAQRDRIDFETAKANTLAREESIKDRFFKYYGIEDMSADEHFDLVVDTTTLPVDGVVDQITAYLKQKGLLS